jgi:hypothetical protein
MENEKREMQEMGMDPNKVTPFSLLYQLSQGRWSEFLKKKRFTPKEKQGMPEFRAGTPMQSLLAKVKHAKSLKKKKKKNK